VVVMATTVDFVHAYTAVNNSGIFFYRFTFHNKNVENEFLLYI
jgi:hypothetical protein